MAVAHDGEVNVSVAVAGATSITLNKTTAGSDRCAVAHTSLYPTNPMTALTYGGTAMTLMREQSSGDTTSYCGLHRMLAPATASTAVVWTINAGALGAVGCSSYNGVHQTTPLGNTAVALGIGTTTTPSTALTSATGEMVLDVLNTFDPTSRTVGAGQTSIFNIQDDTIGGCASREDGAASVTMSWTFNETVDNYWNFVLAALLPSAAAVTAVPYQPLYLRAPVMAQ